MRHAKISFGIHLPGNVILRIRRRSQTIVSHIRSNPDNWPPGPLRSQPQALAKSVLVGEESLCQGCAQDDRVLILPSVLILKGPATHNGNPERRKVPWRNGPPADHASRALRKARTARNLNLGINRGLRASRGRQRIADRQRRHPRHLAQTRLKLIKECHLPLGVWVPVLSQRDLRADDALRVYPERNILQFPQTD